MNKIIIIIFILIFILIFQYYNLDRFVAYDGIFEIKDGIQYININQTHGHFGDHIFNIYFLNKLTNYIEMNNIYINYYFDKYYHEQIKDFIISKNILLKDYEPIGLNLSILNFTYKNNFIKYYINDKLINDNKIDYCELYINIFNETSKILNIPCYFDKFEYENPNLLIEYSKLNDKYKNLDILVINSIPQSHQFNLDIDKWNEFIKNLKNKNFKIVTTLKINDADINCTMDDKLSLFQIGAIATHSNYIIGINTGPMATVFSSYTLEYVKKIYIFDNRVTYKLDKLIHVDNIDDINIDNL